MDDLNDDGCQGCNEDSNDAAPNDAQTLPMLGIEGDPDPGNDQEDHKEAQGYLEAVLADGDQALFLDAMRMVAEAQGGIGTIAKRAKLHRTGLYRFFSAKGNPTYRSFQTVVRAMGFRIRLERVKA